MKDISEKSSFEKKLHPVNKQINFIQVVVFYFSLFIPEHDL